MLKKPSREGLRTRSGMDLSQQSSSKSPEPQRTGWPYIAGAVITLAIQSGWSPADVRSLSAALLVLVAVIYRAQQ
jgi:hypothetical protein